MRMLTTINLTKAMPLCSLVSQNSLESEKKSSMHSSNDSDGSSQGNDPFMLKKIGYEKEMNKKKHDVEKSSNNKDEVGKSN